MTAKATVRAKTTRTMPNAAVAYRIKTGPQFLRWAMEREDATYTSVWTDPVDGGFMTSTRVQVGAWMCTFVWKGSELIEWGVE